LAIEANVSINIYLAVAEPHHRGRGFDLGESKISEERELASDGFNKAVAQRLLPFIVGG
jgi:hypothetical protein